MDGILHGMADETATALLLYFVKKKNIVSAMESVVALFDRIEGYII